jgi:hypothetical protein
LTLFGFGGVGHVEEAPRKKGGNNNNNDDLDMDLDTPLGKPHALLFSISMTLVLLK